MGKQNVDEQLKMIEDRIRLANKNFVAFKTFNENSEEAFSQLDIMKTILKRKDAMVVMPTGGGKSMCFQGPALMMYGITLVISPLRALIADQSNSFNHNFFNDRIRDEQGRRYKAIYFGMKDVNNVLDEIIQPKEEDVIYKLLYVTPERLSNPKFCRRFFECVRRQQINISTIVVDEAHCLSQWGYDFRESYLFVCDFLNKLNKCNSKRANIVAFTATATQRDLDQIELLLNMKKERQLFLSYHVRKDLNIIIKECNDSIYSRQFEIYDILKNYKWTNAKKKPLSCIIYCHTVHDVESLTINLKEMLSEEKHIKICGYHAQLIAEERERIEKNFKKNRYNVMIATKAFGMGVDKDNIGMIIHYNAPKNLEDYYQEIGRAARNRNVVSCADCYLLFDETDFKRIVFKLADSQNTYQKLGGFISSRYTEKFSKEAKNSKHRQWILFKNQQYYEWYRLAQVWYLLPTNEKRHPGITKGISNYFLKGSVSGENNDKVSSKVMKGFLDYLNVIAGEEIDLQKKSIYRSVIQRIPQLRQPDGLCILELIEILKRVNELHINNTQIANIIRWHPEKYELDVTHNIDEFVKFTIIPNRQYDKGEIRKLTYFDMCVLDAIYSIWHKGSERIYIKTIWEVLSGNPNVVFPSKHSRIKECIEHSIETLRSLYIIIKDIHVSLNAPLLVLKDEERGYTLVETPALFQYAEHRNGEIIRVPVGFMRFGGGRLKHQESTIEHAVLCHYLLHRSAIVKRAKRGKYIQIDTMVRIVKPYLPKYIKDYEVCIFTDCMDIMRQFQKVEYIYFYNYVKEFMCRYRVDRIVDNIEEEGKNQYKYFGTFYFNDVTEYKIHEYGTRNQEFANLAVSELTKDILFSKDGWVENDEMQYMYKIEKRITYEIETLERISNRILSHKYDGIYLDV